MRARLILETEKWETIALDAPAPPAAGDAHAGMPGMANMAPPSNNTWTSSPVTAPRSSAISPPRNAPSPCCAARAKRSRADRIPTRAGRSRSSKTGRRARCQRARGQKDEALKLAKDGDGNRAGAVGAVRARRIRSSRRPSFTANYCWKQGARPNAVAALELSLQRTPNRTPSVKALARAKSAGTAMP